MALYGVYDSCCPSLQLSPYQNKIGGYPDFYPGNVLSSAPSCECCQTPLVLLVQLYCPLEASPYHRLLHIFCCTQPTCWRKPNSWVVLRSQLLDVPCEQQEGSDADVSHHATTAGDWCEGADDWGSDTPNPAARALGDVTDNFSNLTMNPETNPIPLSPPHNARQQDDVASVHYQGPCYNSAYIRAVDIMDIQPHSAKVAKLMAKYHSDNPDFALTKGCVSGRSKGKGGVKEKTIAGVKPGGSEKYEKSQAKHGDQTFLKFQKELANCPQQIIRYYWKGAAALMTTTTTTREQELSPSPCQVCGAERVFECQLMPGLVYMLQTRLGRQASHQLPSSPVPVEFGTAIVYSCSTSCWDPATTDSATFNHFREEILVVQFESSE